MGVLQFKLSYSIDADCQVVILSIKFSICPVFCQVSTNLVVAMGADPSFSRKDPAFFLDPFLRFFPAVAILSIEKAVFGKFDLALNRILIIFL